MGWGVGGVFENRLNRSNIAHLNYARFTRWLLNASFLHFDIVNNTKWGTSKRQLMELITQLSPLGTKFTTSLVLSYIKLV